MVWSRKVFTHRQERSRGLSHARYAANSSLLVRILSTTVSHPPRTITIPSSYYLVS